MINIFSLSRHQNKILGMALLSAILLFGIIPLLKMEVGNSSINNSPFGTATTITITSPTGTYSDPMTGYYVATFGFENDAAGADPEGWTVYEETGTTISVVDTQASHRKSLELIDSSSVNNAAAAQYFGTHDSGTVEVWVMSTDASKPTDILLYGTGNLKVQLIISGNYLYYWNGANWIQTTCVISNSVWYRVSIHYDLVNFYYNPPYIPENSCDITFSVKVNDIAYISNIYFEGTTFPQHIVSLWGFTDDSSTGYTSRFDAIGYSWDVDYDAGDNEHKGLLLDITDDATDVEYQLDGGPTYSILGDTVLRMPYSGNHTIKVFSSNYDTGTANFTVA